MVFDLFVLEWKQIGRRRINQQEVKEEDEADVDTENDVDSVDEESRAYDQEDNDIDEEGHDNDSILVAGKWDDYDEDLETDSNGAKLLARVRV